MEPGTQEPPPSPQAALSATQHHPWLLPPGSCISSLSACKRGRMKDKILAQLPPIHSILQAAFAPGFSSSNDSAPSLAHPAECWATVVSFGGAAQVVLSVKLPPRMLEGSPG